MKRELCFKNYLEIMIKKICYLGEFSSPMKESQFLQKQGRMG